jgi:hypothetical protein
MPLHTPPRDCSPENDYLHARLNSPDDYSLAELLDSFYHHFGISDYLDQIGNIENSIDNDFDGG